LPDYTCHNKPKWGKIYQNGNKNIPNSHKIYQNGNIPNGHEMHQSFPCQVVLKYTNICIFGMKMYHLATLHSAKKAKGQSPSTKEAK
jgi:hypothetical protein